MVKALPRHFPEHLFAIVSSTTFTPVKFLPLPRPLSREVVFNTLQVFYKACIRERQGSIIRVCLYVRGAAHHLVINRLGGVHLDVVNLVSKQPGANAQEKPAMHMPVSIGEQRMVAIDPSPTLPNYEQMNALSVVAFMIYKLHILSPCGLAGHTNGQ